MQWIVCGPRIYKYDGWLFEWHSYCGPWPLRKDGELRKTAGRHFWEMIARFQALNDAERKQYQVVGGGCTVLTTGSTVTAAPVELAANNLDLAQPQVNPDR